VLRRAVLRQSGVELRDGVLVVPKNAVLAPGTVV